MPAEAVVVQAAFIALSDMSVVSGALDSENHPRSS